MKFLALLITLFSCLITEAQDLYPLKKEGRYGYIDSKGSWVISPRFNKASYYTSSHAIASSGDSVFLILNMREILFIPGVRNYKFLSGKTYAIQNISGKWALADSSLSPLSDFRYNKIDTLDDVFIASTSSGKGLITKTNRTLLPFKYNYLKKIANGFIKASASNGDEIFKRNDSMLLLLSGPNILYNEKVPDIFMIYDKAIKKYTVYNLKGELIYSCAGCVSYASLEKLLLIGRPGKLHLISLEDARIISESPDRKNFVFDNNGNGFVLARNTGKLYFGNSSGPVLDSSYFIDTVQRYDNNLLSFRKGNEWGLINLKGEIIIPCIYKFISKVNDSMALCYIGNSKQLYYLKENRIILTASQYSDLSIDNESILVYNPRKTSTFYSMDSRLYITDSTNIENLQVVHAGTRVAIGNPLDDQAMNVNTSTSSRWFMKNSRFGLLGFNNDTLVKNIFSSVRRINDSTDIVAMRTSLNLIKHIPRVGKFFTSYRYGIINNRTGKYIVKTSLLYIDDKQFSDTSFECVKVVLQNGNYVLMNKSDYSLIKGTQCSYITHTVNGYMRLFYRSEFTRRSVASQKANEKKSIYLSDISGFMPFCDVREIDITNSGIYISSIAVNISDKEGKLKWDVKKASLYNFVDEGKYGNFITIDHFNNFGVNSDTGTIIPNLYLKITRLSEDDHYFILKLNNLKYGYVNKQGNEITEAIFKTASDFGENYAWGNMGDTMTIISSEGETNVLDIPVSKTNIESGGITSYKTRKGWQLINVNGDKISDDYYKQLKPFLNGYAVASLRDKFGFINESGEWVIQPQFNSFVAENANGVVFEKNNSYHFFKRDGTFLYKTKGKGTIKALGDHYFIRTNSKVQKLLPLNESKFRKKRFINELRCINDTVISISKSQVVYYNTAGKRMYYHKHSGGSKSFDKNILKLNKKESGRIKIVLNIHQSEKLRNHDCYDSLGSTISLTRPDFFNCNLINLHMNKCIKYNAFIYSVRDAAVPVFVLCDSLGNLLSPIRFHKLTHLEENLFKASFTNINGDYVTGILNQFGIWVVEPKFMDIRSFSNGNAVYSKQTDFWIADSNGKLISTEILSDYIYQNGYYCLRTEFEMAWWHPEKGWLSPFSR